MARWVVFLRFRWTLRSHAYRSCVFAERVLYGHPDAGTHWEQHAETYLSLVGFVPIPDWKSCFRHSRLGFMLIVYVYDFKFPGPKENLKEGWTLIRKGMITGEPEPIGRYLGCEDRVLEALIPAGGNPAHADIPEPPPKSETLKPPCGDDNFRAIQPQQRSGTQKRKIDYEITTRQVDNWPKSGLCFMSWSNCSWDLKVYLKLAEQQRVRCAYASSDAISGRWW